MVALRITPTTRTIDYLEARGWSVDIAERRQGPITRDLFGCVDLVAAHPERREVLFLQVTGDSGGNVAFRVAKTMAQPATQKLLQAGLRIEVWGWRASSPEPRIVRLSQGSAWLEQLRAGRPVEAIALDAHQPAAEVRRVVLEAIRCEGFSATTAELEALERRAAERVGGAR